MHYAGHKVRAILISLLLVAGMLWIQFADPPLLGDFSKRLELLVFDLRLKSIKRPASDLTSKVVIVDIDELSLQEHGRWPWSRAKVAELVERLTGAGTAVIAFDVMFSEPEANPAMTVAEVLNQQGENIQLLAGQLAQWRGTFDYDRRFAEVLAGKEVVLGYTFSHRESQQTGLLPAALTIANPQTIANSSLVPMLGFTANLPVLTEAALGGGFFSMAPDVDGVVRRAPLVARHEDRIYASLALETIRHYMLADALTLHTSSINGVMTVEAVQLEGMAAIPTDADGQMIVPYIGPGGSFPYISASDVLAGRSAPGMLEGAIVLVGTTAPGLFDLRSTPVQAVYPGVEIHANLIEAILSGRYLEQPAWARGADFVVALLAGMAIALVLPLLAPFYQIVWAFAVAAGLLLLNLSLWQHGFVLSLAMPMVLVALLSTFNLGYGFLVESRSRRRLKEMFGQYVPPQIVDKMTEGSGNYGFEGETRELTVLFADIRGFTALAETLSAADLKKLLNRYFTPMTRIIFETGGTIDKYVGDQIMAFWGAPVPDERHAHQAIEASLRMLAETERLSQEFTAENLPEIAIGIGLNSGPMSVGDMGSEFRRAYTVLGDAVNLGARLEGTSKYYGVGLVVGEATRQLAGDVFIFRELDTVRVKGKAQAIHIYEPICRTEAAGAEQLQALAAYHQALTDFRARRWGAAQAGFARLKDAEPGRRIHALYLERIADLAADDPGETWDGVYQRTEK